MKNYKKNLLIFFFSLIPFLSYGYEESIILTGSEVSSSDSKIESFEYEGHLGENENFYLDLTDLDRCERILNHNKYIDFYYNSVFDIIIKKEDLRSYEGKLSLSCYGRGFDIEYNFPYIREYKTDFIQGDFYLIVKGVGFGTDPKLIIDGGEHELIYKDEEGEYLKFKISGEIKSREFYIQGDNLMKSNKKKLDFKIPILKTVSIKSDKIIICGDDLNWGKSFKFYLNDIEFNNYYIKDGCFNINDDYLYYRNDIYIENNGIKSNSLTFNYEAVSPIIKNISLYDTGFLINGKNFGFNKEYIEVYKNNSKLSINHFSDEKIIVKGDLNKKDNYFYLDKSGLKSNYFLFNISNEKIEKLPLIGSIKTSSTYDGKRRVKIYFSRFNQDLDILYHNGSKIDLLNCSYNMCNVEIPDNIYYGYFEVGNDRTKSSVKKYYDLRSSYQPYIEKITFSDGIKSQGHIDIEGYGFKDSVFSVSGLFSLDEEDKPEYNISDKEINGLFPYTLDKDVKVSISIKKDSLSHSFSFPLSEVDGKYVYGAPIVYYAEKIDNNILKIYGKLFTKNDIVNISGIKLPVINNSKYSSKFSYIYVKIPDDIKSGKHSIFVENNKGLQSGKVDVIFESSIIKKPLFTKKSISDSYLLNNNDEEKVLYSFLVNNYKKDYESTNFSFQIDEKFLEDNSNLFYLEINGEKTSYIKADNKGKLDFENLLLPIFEKEYEVNLYQVGPILKKGEYIIKLLSIDYFNKRNIDFPLFRNLEEYITIEKYIEKSCFDGREDKLYCNTLDIENENKLYEEKLKSRELKKQKNIKESNSAEKKVTVNTKKVEINYKGLNEYEYKNTQFKSIKKVFDNKLKHYEEKGFSENKLLELEQNMNDILKNIYSYEKTKNGSAQRKFFTKKIIENFTKYKSLIK